ncbi:DNA cytosine methyltransferase [Comamonas sp. 26]|uniref:DNA cytosine methyltransferase n=1 Tax=Comamonas sp. 26 TaxID=2035201 RepID=UPI001E5FA3CD|nr:DNA cytosine methyltransferase [Comamonas sp. 26]
MLRNLIAAGHIAPGDVDERSIEDVHPSDLKPYTQCHFFAGVGVWSHALRRAGWPDDRPVWTGSCPCQPFSAAGAGAGFDDQRHLWPHFHWLISECRPPAIFGEQVASRDANPWIDLVQDDLEGVGYRVGAVPFPSAGVGAPHIRDRLYWMAYADEGRRGRRPLNGQLQRDRPPAGWIENAGNPARPGSICGLEHSGQHDDAGQSAAANTWHTKANGSSDQSGGPGIPSFRMADTDHNQQWKRRGPGGQGATRHESGTEPRGCSPADGLGLRSRTSPTNGHWSAADWLLCRDGKWRPVEPGSFPLAHGAPARVGRLRAYGNAINAEAARVFIEAAMSCMP